MVPLLALDLRFLWHGASVFILLWLAWCFGRTLARGRIPLIEQIARIGEPELQPFLVGYTRRLTWLWCAYFVVGAIIAVLLFSTSFPVGVAVGMGSLLLFVGEHALRPRFFPGEAFPGLVQQVRDTWAVWNAVHRAPDVHE
jgi:uncharacterized membrane protein